MVAIARTDWRPQETEKSSLSKIDSANLEIVQSPFGVRVDNQEKAGWSFGAIPADKSKSKGKQALIAVPVTCDSHLKFGDYAIIGLEDHFRIERKSKEDMYGTIAGVLGHDSEEKKKQRLNEKYEISEHWFLRQLEGLNSLNGYGHVIVECSFQDLLIQPPSTAFKAKSVVRKIFSWRQAYPMVHWHFPGGKHLCEIYAYQLMSKFFDHHARMTRQTQDAHG